ITQSVLNGDIFKLDLIFLKPKN
ncbi:uncharacterized protein METZ01_LOCUS310965, partial [marine metagenome]